MSGVHHPEKFNSAVTAVIQYLLDEDMPNVRLYAADMIAMKQI